MHIFRFFIFIGDATVTICHRYTPPEQLHVFTKTADIIVVATGIPKLITADMVKEGVAVIDIGINRIVDEKTGKTRLVGDVDFEGKILYIYCTLLVVRGNTTHKCFLPSFG
jgi:5,10-methylene-tetrahydrofolate dehydrogenase/methenyl tetrahydrofolate cyclohydrolase